MSVEANQLNNANEKGAAEEEGEEEEEASTSSTSLSQSNDDDEDNNNLMSPSLCKQGILKHFEAVVNRLHTGWKYHVANTPGIKDSWIKFEDFYTNVCQFTGGQ